MTLVWFEKENYVFCRSGSDSGVGDFPFGIPGRSAAIQRCEVVDLNTQNPSILQRLRRFEFIRGRARRLSNWARYREIERQVDIAAGKACQKHLLRSPLRARGTGAALSTGEAWASEEHSADALEIGSYLRVGRATFATAR